MITKELVDYIATAKAQGLSFETIKTNLLSQGWHADEIEEAYGIGHVPTPTVTPPLRSKKKWLFVSIGVVVLLLGAGVVYAYVAGYFTPLDRIAVQAIQAARQANSAVFDTTTTIEIPKTDNSNSLSLGSMFGGRVMVTTKGGYDFTDSTNPTFGVTLSVVANKFEAAIEGRLINKVLYARLTKAPSIAFLDILKSAENKWVSFPKGDTGKEAALLPLDSLLPISSAITEKLTDAQKEQFITITENAHFITVTKRLTPEMMSGSLSYHFTFTLDQKGIKQYLQDMQNYLHSSGSNDSFLSSLDLTSYSDNIDRIKNFTGEAWIGERDHLPHKLMLQFQYADSAETQPTNVTFASIFSGWNKPYSVEVPTGATTFDEFLKQMTGSPAMEQSRQKGTDAAIKSDLSNMRAFAEIHYSNNNASYKGFCATEDPLKMVKSKSYANAYYCADGATGFAMSEKISDGQYYCVDATGYAGTQGFPPRSTICNAPR